jgi:transposase-like protein
MSRRAIPESVRAIVVRDLQNGDIPAEVARRHGVSAPYCSRLARRHGPERHTGPITDMTKEQRRAAWISRDRMPWPKQEPIDKRLRVFQSTLAGF